MSKILIITLEYPPLVGGIASYVANYARTLPPEDIVLYAPVMLGYQAYDALQPYKTYRQTPLYRFFWPRWIRMWWQVKKIIRAEQINELHIHHVLPVGYIGQLCRRFLKIPYTIFFHGTDFTVASRSQWKLSRIRAVARRATRIAVNSEWLANRVAEQLDAENCQITTPIIVMHPCPSAIFFNAIDDNDRTQLYSRLALSGKKVILSVARFGDGKGYPHLLRLMPSILEAVPQLVWLIIGDGPKKNMFVDLVQKNGLQNVVRLLGTVAYDELPLYYSLANLFVLLTHPDEEANESWGTVFLEAAASGIPVIAGRAGGVDEAVEDRVTGLVVDVFQPAAVSRAIIDLLKRPDYAKQMGEAGRERVKKEFRWEKEILKLGNRIPL